MSPIPLLRVPQRHPPGLLARTRHMFRRGAEDQSSDMPALPSESVGLFVIQALTPSMEKLVLAAFVNGAFNTTVTNRAISVRSVSSTVANSVDHDEAIHLLYDMVRTKSVQKVVKVGELSQWANMVAMEAITRLLIDHPTASASTTEPLMLEQDTSVGIGSQNDLG